MLPQSGVSPINLRGRKKISFLTYCEINVIARVFVPPVLAFSQGSNFHFAEKSVINRALRGFVGLLRLRKERSAQDALLATT
jgi:hypothetical protein